MRQTYGAQVCKLGFDGDGTWALGGKDRPFGGGRDWD